MASPTDVVVVGAGPNGLTAAARLALAGRSVLVVEAQPTIGGGSRTTTLGDARIDPCASVHPFGASSPAFEALDLASRGLRWRRPPLGLAHPFDDGTAAVLDGVEGTAAALDDDAERWLRLLGPFARNWDRWRHLTLQPLPPAVARHPLAMARLGSLGLLPATALARLFRGRDARALVAGFAAHTGESLGAVTSGGVAVGLLAAGMATGLPFAEGGSQAIVDALAAVVEGAGGRIETGRRVGHRRELPPCRALLLDVPPDAAAAILGRPPPRWRHGVASWKLDLVLSEPLPWRAEACHRAGTVHVGGDPAAIAASERATARGGLPDEPYLIVAQSGLADPGRAPAGQHVVWAYRHVPNGCTDERATAGIERQLDRFAPGWRDVVLARRVTTPAAFEAYNPAYLGGDIAGGAMTPWQTVARPRLALDPYRIPGVDDAWLCSQSTPPGPGVHGMCGWHAAGSALRAPALR